MVQKNANLMKLEELTSGEEEYFDFEQLQDILDAQIHEQMSDLEFLDEEYKKIGGPDGLGDVVYAVVCEQFNNQLAAVAGEEFIKNNRGMTLDLRDDAHIQTTENFADGKIATHNTEIDYQRRYDDWQSNFEKDENGNIKTHTTRSGKTAANLANGARKPFDKDRPKGSKEKNTDMDHTVSAGEIIRDHEANAHMTKDEQIAFANSEANLNEMDSSQNRSKGDTPTEEWLENPNANGQKPEEIFGLSENDKKKLRAKDRKARKEYEKRKKEGEKRSIEAGKKSQRDEAVRMGKASLKAVAMQLLTDLLKEIIAKLVKWFKAAKRTISSLCDSIGEAVGSFIRNLKNHLLNAGSTGVNTIVAAIVGPIFGLLRKVWMMIKMAWKSLKDAINYIKDQANKGKPFSILMLEASKIIVAGLTGMGAIVLSEAIEKGLLTFPIFATEIPLIGSLASICGIFFGAVTSGIIGAIVINYIDRKLAQKRKQELVKQKIDKSNEILQLQQMQSAVSEAKTMKEKKDSSSNIRQRHEQASEIMKDSLTKIMDNEEKNDKIHAGIDSDLDDIDAMLTKLQNDLSKEC